LETYITVTFYILGIAVFLFGTFSLGLYALIINPFLETVRINKRLSRKQRDILLKHFKYYRDLSGSQKIDFEKRIRNFLIHKEFIPKGIPEITEEMEILVAACGVQLTFGFPPVRFESFPKIIIYPSHYQSSNGKRHKGEVSLNGFIAFSWEDFMYGYKKPEDGFNLGLHEMAHALKIEDALHHYQQELLDHESLKEWGKISRQEIKKIKTGKMRFLRPYAFNNEDEFFAVCVEYFFEKPEEFKMQLPALYSSLSKLLKQDPGKALQNAKFYFYPPENRKLILLMNQAIKELPNLKTLKAKVSFTKSLFVKGRKIS
jgi:Mlc titration factor MtfA (ptsG expression regulator)